MKFLKKIYINIKKKITNPKFRKRINIALISIIIITFLYIIIKLFIIRDSYKLWTSYEHLNEICLGFILIIHRCFVKVVVEYNYLKLVNYIIKITLWFKLNKKSIYIYIWICIYLYIKYIYILK